MKDARKPSPKFIESYLQKHNRQFPYDTQSYNASLKLISLIPKNKKFEDIFIKVNFINGAFKTRIGDTSQLSKNILKIKNLDERLTKGDCTLIKEVGHYTSRNDKDFNFYSFASKYCHCHNPEKFPIFDRYVKESLEYYRNNFPEFKRFFSNHLREYKYYCEVIENFKHFAKATHLSYSKIDRFLWSQSQPEV